MLLPDLLFLFNSLIVRNQGLKSLLTDSPFLHGSLVVVLDAGLEHALVHTAQRAAPVIGKRLERSAGSDAVLRVTFLRIISITTGITKIFLHNISLLFYF